MTRSKKTRTRVKGRSTVYTFAHLRTVSYECLKRSETTNHGSKLMLCASMMFSAFTVEAFLNHVGANRTPFWPSVERKLSPLDKLEVLSKLLGITIQHDRRPFQTFKRMFRFRDALAHGKTESFAVDNIQLLREDQEPQLPMTAWEKEINLPNAKLYFHDTKEMVQVLCDKSGLDPIQLMVTAEHGWFVEPSVRES